MISVVIGRVGYVETTPVLNLLLRESQKVVVGVHLLCDLFLDKLDDRVQTFTPP